MSIRYADRVFVVGATGTGKSTLAAELFRTVAEPRLVIDPADSSLTARVAPGAPRVPGTGDPDRVAHLLTAAFRNHGTVRFVPGQPTRGDEYDAAYRWCFDRFPRFVWLDEAEHAAPARGTPPNVSRYLVQGRKRQLGHLACHTRPRDVSRHLIAQAQHVMIFDLPNPDDAAHVAGIVGIPPAELAAELAQLEPHGWLWFDQRERALTVCPPVRAAAA